MQCKWGVELENKGGRFTFIFFLVSIWAYHDSSWFRLSSFDKIKSRARNSIIKTVISSFYSSLSSEELKPLQFIRIYIVILIFIILRRRWFFWANCKFIFLWRMLGNVFQGSGDRFWNWWWRWQMESGRLITIFVGDICYRKWDTFLWNPTGLPVDDHTAYTRFGNADAIVTFVIESIRAIFGCVDLLRFNYGRTLWLCVGIRLAEGNRHNARHNNYLFMRIRNEKLKIIENYLNQYFSRFTNLVQHFDNFYHSLWMPVEY